MLLRGEAKNASSWWGGEGSGAAAQQKNDDEDRDGNAQQPSEQIADLAFLKSSWSKESHDGASKEFVVQRVCVSESEVMHGSYRFSEKQNDRKSDDFAAIP